jgi:glc operon protein GlcG
MTGTTDTVPSDSISLDAARRVLDAALAHAESMSRAMCITVCDPAGDAVLSARMDGAPRMTAQIAADKAWTVTGFGGLPTHDWWPMIEHDPALVHGITKTPRLVVFGGGVALRVGGRVVGAIGVSGGSSADDRAVAEAGAAALGS